MDYNPSIFKAYDIRGLVGQDYDDEFCEALGRAFVVHTGAKVVVAGRDMRGSSPGYFAALTRGIMKQGADVIDIGMVSTPMFYFAVADYELHDAGIMVTASHNPAEYNGFKLCLGTESLHGHDIQQLFAHIDEPASATKGRVREHEVVERYVHDVASRIGRISRPIRVVYDCGNGAATRVAPQLFRALGLDAVGLFTEDDGTFPNHHPDPTVPANLEDLIAAVRREGAEIGIAFDGDADRIGMVDGTGRIVWGDHLLILYARDVFSRLGKGIPVIFDVKCSQALPDAIAKAGGTPVMWKTGHSLIKEKMKELHAPLAGEMSGHMFFAEGYYGYDDALYGAARLLRIVADSGHTVQELLADVPEFVSTPEIRVDCGDDVKFGIVEHAVKYFRDRYDVIDVDGVRVLFGDGWGLIRASNTQPILVTRFEARSPERLAEIQGEMEGWLRQQGVTV